MSSLTHNAGKYNLFDPRTFAYLIDGDQFATLRYRLRPKSSESFMKYKTTQLTSFAIDLLQSAGLPSDKAKSVAEVLVEGDLLGHTTHGLALLAPYLAEIEKGSMRTSQQRLLGMAIEARAPGWFCKLWKWPSTVPNCRVPALS
jgi:hypothetical protein